MRAWATGGPFLARPICPLDAFAAFADRALSEKIFSLFARKIVPVPAQKVPCSCAKRSLFLTPRKRLRLGVRGRPGRRRELLRALRPVAATPKTPDFSPSDDFFFFRMAASAILMLTMRQAGAAGPIRNAAMGDEKKFYPMPAAKPGSPSSHVWTVRLPADLQPGTYRVEVEAVNEYGKTVREGWRWSWRGRARRPMATNMRGRRRLVEERRDGRSTCCPFFERPRMV